MWYHSLCIPLLSLQMATVTRPAEIVLEEVCATTRPEHAAASLDSTELCANFRQQSFNRRNAKMSYIMYHTALSNDELTCVLL